MKHKNNTQTDVSQLELLDQFMKRRNPDGYIELRPCYEQRRGIDVSARRWFTVDEFCEKKEIIIEYCRQNVLGCFVGVLSRTVTGRGDASSVDAGNVIWCDIDDKDHNGSRSAVWSLVNGLPLEPSVIVESGGGLHLYYWIATDTPADDIEDLNERLAALCGGDSCFDKARVLRLPCSYHQKDPNAVKMVRFVKMELQVQYTVEELFSNFPAVTKSRILKTERIHHMPRYELTDTVTAVLKDNPRLESLFRGFGKTGGDSSGSGYDFAFSKEALWCGLSREDVVDALSVRVKNRGTSKSAVYITRTVERAYAVVQQRQNPSLNPAVDPVGDPTVYVALDKYPDDHREKGKRGKPTTTDLNLYRILTLDPMFSGRIRYNLFKNRIEIDFTTETVKMKPNDGENWKRMQDVYTSLLRHEIAKSYGLQFRTQTTNEQIQFVASQNPIHPVREWLKNCTWTPEQPSLIDTWLTRFCGAPDTDLISAYGRKFLMSCIARVMKPACQVDTVLILTGGQGTGKSTVFRELAVKPEWFRDSALNVGGGRDAYSLLAGVWIYEFPELHQTRTRDAESVKAFITSRHDSYRPAYAHYDVDVPRQVVFVGTSNEKEILRDPTGSRRFMVVETGEIKTEELRQSVPALWGEAFYIWENGTDEDRKWWFDEMTDEMQRHAEKFQAVDVWSTAVLQWLNNGHRIKAVRDGYTMLEIFQGAINPPQQTDRFETAERPVLSLNRAHQMRMSGVLTGLGFDKVRKRVDGSRVYLWKLGADNV